MPMTAWSIDITIRPIIAGAARLAVRRDPNTQVQAVAQEPFHPGAVSFHGLDREGSST
jgi:hypothetical protein